jgi:hypothetical protein
MDRGCLELKEILLSLLEPKVLYRLPGDEDYQPYPDVRRDLVEDASVQYGDRPANLLQAFIDYRSGSSICEQC